METQNQQPKVSEQVALSKFLPTTHLRGGGPSKPSSSSNKSKGGSKGSKGFGSSSGSANASKPSEQGPSLLTKCLTGWWLDEKGRAASWRTGDTKGAVGIARATKVTTTKKGRERRKGFGPVAVALNRDMAAHDIVEKYGQELPEQGDDEEKWNLQDGKMFYVLLDRDEGDEEEGSGSDDGIAEGSSLASVGAKTSKKPGSKAKKKAVCE